MSNKTLKAQLRRTLLQKRLSLSQSEWQQKSINLCHVLATIPIFIKAQTVLAYFSFQQEPDLSFWFFDRCQHRQWGFPRCVGKSLVWHAWQPGDRLQTGTYNISEPDTNAPLLNLDRVDLVLVPAIACDNRGYRLGYGGGFYDRMLSSPLWAGKPTIGIIFDFAYLSEIPVESWDRKLDYICTDRTSFQVTKY